MSRRDFFHQTVRTALEKEGWTVTHDPYFLEFGEQRLQVDIGAEMPLAAEREGRKIAVEIKSFAGVSAISDLYHAIGQYLLYRTLLRKSDPDRVLYLAVPDEAYATLLYPEHGREVREELRIQLIVYEVQEETIKQWIE